MQRSCPTVECCRANQILFRCDEKPLNIYTMQLNVNDEHVIEAAAMKQGYSGSRENQIKVYSVS